MTTYRKIGTLPALRFLHRILPLKHKLDFLIGSYLHSSSVIAIRYVDQYAICTPVTDMNRRTVSELIFEGTGSQPEVFLIKELQQRLKNNLCFIDVGGNIGTFTWQFANKSDIVKIFEPIPRLNRVIEESIAYNHAEKIELIKKAVGDHPHVVRMHDNNNSSVVEDVNTENTIDVEVTTLDDELKDLAKIDFIKIDVEGFELHVLKGGEKIINKHHPALLVELHPGFIRNYNASCMDVIELLERWQYNITYYSFLEEMRLPKVRRIMNRWSGNPGKKLESKAEFIEDLKKKPELSSYHLYCEPR